MGKPSFTRRGFLGGAAAGAGAYVLLGGPAILTSTGRLASSGSFTQSVASSQPTDTGISLWTRVAELGGNGKVGVEVARDAGFANVVHRDRVGVISGNPVAKTRVGGLATGEQFFYRFFTDGETSPVGRFRTTRGDSNDSVKVAFFSCERYSSGFYHAHRDLASNPDFDDVDLVVCLGDYIYESAGSGGQAREDSTAEDGVQVQTLAEYRAKYDLYHSDPDLLAVRQKFPLMSIWDDHEHENNYAAEFPGSTESRRVTVRDRQASAYRSFFEYMPQMPISGERDRIFGSLKLGRHAEVFLLDTRQFRDNQVCSPEDSSPAPPGCPPSEYNRPGRTMLGEAQERWLKDGLERSQGDGTTWKVIANQVMIMSLDTPQRSPLNVDQWDGYGDERRDLLEFIGKQGIGDVTFVTGDIHAFFAGNVTRSGREGAPLSTREANEAFVIPDGPSRATEFVGGSVSTPGITDDFDPGDSRIRQLVGEGGNALVESNNPHIKYADLDFRGYGILEASATELRVEYRGVRDAKSEDDDRVFTLARFRVDKTRVPGQSSLAETERLQPPGGLP